MKLNQKTVVGLLFPAVLLFVGSLFLAPPSAQAHGGHAGKTLEFVAKTKALKAMLPAGTKISKRKEQLTNAAADKVENKWGVALDREVYTYYLARDRESGDTVGTALVTVLHYRHGKVQLALGLDMQGHITQAAVLNVDSKYLPDLERSIGTGFLSALQGKSVDDLKEVLDGVAKDDLAAKEVLGQLRNMIAVLSVFRQDD